MTEDSQRLVEQDLFDADAGDSAPSQSAQAVPDHVRAQYPDRAFFEYREVFLRHLMRDLSGRLHARKDQPAPTCLDIGCNAGRYTRLLANHGFAARGVDYSEALVAEARRENPGMVFDQGDAQDLPYADGSFDAVSTVGLLQCLSDWKFALAEAVRVLKPGGVALVETNRAFPWWERVLKAGAYLARRQMRPGEACTWYRAHALGAARPLEQGLRKFGRTELLDWVAAMPLKYVVVHDPRKQHLLHDFMWAVTLAKRGPGDADDVPPVITECVNCRRYGVVHMRGGGTLWMS
ncbi:MAG: class I SAM-dependent methyltransferase [Verrucomicrobia bacterium]|nr:class I SAM-dependent methyltransferase [Verrucomicrobiota bacterium]